MWQYQTVVLAEHGLRCISYDRRGHGRSDAPSKGYDFDTLADDLAALLDSLDLHDVTLVGHSMGCGEVVRYLSRHGSARIARIALLSPITPYLQHSDDNPQGIPAAAFAGLRGLWRADFPKWIADNTKPFFTPNTSPQMMQWVVDMMLRASLPIIIECNQQYVQADQRKEIAALNTPTLIVHGDADASAPIQLTGQRTAALLPSANFKVYPGAPHGLFITHMQQLNADLLAFIGAPA